MTFDYSVEKGQLIIRELSTGHVVQQVFEAPIIQLLPSSKDDGCLVLLDPSAMKKPTFENLFPSANDFVSGRPQPTDDLPPVACVMADWRLFATLLDQNPLVLKGGC